MLSDNPRYTSRQREIIAQIGREHRGRLKKHKRNVILSFAGMALLMFAFCGFIITLDRSFLYVSIFFCVVVPIMFGYSTVHQLKTYDSFKTKDDYSVGLFFADSDVQVKGSARKKQKTLRLVCFLGGGITLAVAAVTCAAALAQKPMDFSKLERVEGKIQTVEATDNFIEIRLQNDETEYIVSPLYAEAFDLNAFLAVSDKETPLILLCEDASTGRKSVCFAEFKGTVFLSEEEVVEADKRDTAGLYGLFGVFAAISGALFIAPFVYHATIYKKNLAKEIYDLNFTDEELQSVSPPGPEAAERTAEAPVVSIRTGAPRWIKVFMWIMFVGGLIGILCGAIFPKTTELKLIVSLCCLFFFLLGFLGVLDLLLNRELLEGDKLIVRRFFVKKEIPVKDIRRIALSFTWWVFYGADSRVLCRIDVSSLGVHAMIENLAQRGVLVENFLPPSF